MNSNEDELNDVILDVIAEYTPYFPDAIWKTIEGYENLYVINNYGLIIGTVRSRVLQVGRRFVSHRVGLTKNAETKTLCLEKLLLEIFPEGEVKFNSAMASVINHLPNPKSQDLDGEIWKPIVEFTPKFMVSNMGRVKLIGDTSKNSGTSRGAVVKDQVLVTRKDPSGYIIVSLYYENNNYLRRVHRLVAEAFLPNPDNLPVVNHIDGNKSNSKLCNLEWVSILDNMAHAIQTGLRDGHGIFTSDEVAAILNSYNTSDVSQTELARFYGVSVSVISNIVNHKSYRNYLSEENK